MAIIAKLDDGRVLAKVTGTQTGTTVSIPVPDISTIEEIISVNVVSGVSNISNSAINTVTKAIDITFAATGTTTVDVIVLGF